MNLKIIAVLLLASVYAMAQQPQPSISPAKGEGDNDCKIAVAVSIDKDALANVQKTKRFPFIVAIKNNGTEEAAIDDIPINHGVSFYAITASGERIAIFPTGEPYAGSAGAIALAPGEAVSVKVALPMAAVDLQNKKFVVSVTKLGNPSTHARACIAFSEPFFLPSLPSVK